VVGAKRRHIVNDHAADVDAANRGQRMRQIAGKDPGLQTEGRRIDLADGGVVFAGLSTTVLPAAITGATLCATRLRGKLNGAIAATTPTGQPPFLNNEIANCRKPGNAGKPITTTAEPEPFRPNLLSLKDRGVRVKRMD